MMYSIPFYSELKNTREDLLIPILTHNAPVLCKIYEFDIKYDNTLPIVGIRNWVCSQDSANDDGYDDRVQNFYSII